MRTSVQAGPLTSSTDLPEPATGTASAANAATSSAMRFLNVASLLRDEGGVGAAQGPARAGRPGEGDRHALVRDPLALEVGDERGAVDLDGRDLIDSRCPGESHAAVPDARRLAANGRDLHALRGELAKVAVGKTDVDRDGGPTGPGVQRVGVEV